MKSFDFDAVVYDGAVYCVECLPQAPDGYEHQQVTVDSEEVSPIFADSEWDTAPVCDACGTVHDYMTILQSDEDTDDDEPAEENCPECERSYGPHYAGPCTH